jgi:hypothetical protein
LTTPKFISTLYDEAIEINGEIPNLASMLRTTCALYLRGSRPDGGKPRPTPQHRPFKNLPRRGEQAAYSDAKRPATMTSPASELKPLA